MKVINELLSFVFFIFIACGCKNEIEEDLNTVILDAGFDIGEARSSMSLSEIIDSVSYLPIQSNLLIGMIGDIRYIKHRYYILDGQMYSLYVMDEKGHIINSISAKGPAPYEYVTLQGFDINPFNEEISLFDNSSRRMLIYSKEGSFLRSFSTKEVIRDFAVLHNGEYLFYTPDFMKENRRGLWRVDKEGKFKEQLVTLDDAFLYGGIYPKYFRRIDDMTVGLMGTEDFNRIYHITADTILVKYKIEIDKIIPKELLSKPILNFNNYKGIVYTKNDYLETASLVTLTVTDMERQIWLFYNKYNKKFWKIKRQEDLIDDINIYVKFRYSGNNTLIGILSPEIVLSYPILKKQFPYITSDSNPILVISHIK